MCGLGEFLAVQSQWDITLRMRVQGTGRKHWRGCCTDTMSKESRGCAKDGFKGRGGRIGVRVGLGDEGCGCKSYFYAFGVQEKPWEHVNLRASVLRACPVKIPVDLDSLSDDVLNGGRDVLTVGRKTGSVLNLHVEAGHRLTRDVGDCAA